MVNAKIMPGMQKMRVRRVEIFARENYELLERDVNLFLESHGKVGGIQYSTATCGSDNDLFVTHSVMIEYFEEV